MQEIAKGLKKYNIRTVALQETSWQSEKWNDKKKLYRNIWRRSQF